jgi:hypothetical protein
MLFVKVPEEPADPCGMGRKRSFLWIGTIHERPNSIYTCDRQLEINNAVREADQVKGGGIERCATRRQRAPHGPTRPTRLELKPRTRSWLRLKEKRTALVRSDVSESRAQK